MAHVMVLRKGPMINVNQTRSPTKRITKMKENI
jgi:hypothetical protein